MALSLPKAWVQSLVREIRSCKPHSTAKKRPLVLTPENGPHAGQGWFQQDVLRASKSWGIGHPLRGHNAGTALEPSILESAPAIPEPAFPHASPWLCSCVSLPPWALSSSQPNLLPSSVKPWGGPVQTAPASSPHVLKQVHPIS